MNGLFFTLALVAQGIMVAGQIQLKRAMMLTVRPLYSRQRFAARFGLAIGCMTLYFFLWLGLSHHLDLSQLAPFDALGPLLLVAVVSLVLKERITVRAWVGVALILCGVAAISLS